MKSAISMPDALFERVTSRARDMGVSRSAFISTAAERYLRELAANDITTQLDAAIAASSVRDDDWTSGSRASLSRQLEDDEW